MGQDFLDIQYVAVFTSHKSHSRDCKDKIDNKERKKES